MPFVTIAPAEFAAKLEEFALDLVRAIDPPSTPAEALALGLRLAAYQAIAREVETYRELSRVDALKDKPLLERAVPFRHRVPGGLWLS